MAGQGWEPSAPPAGEIREESSTAVALSSASAAAAAETAQAPAPTAAGLPTNLEELWIQLVEAVGRVSGFTRSYLLEAHPVSFDKNLLTIGFDPEFEDHIGLVDNPRNHALLPTKLADLGHPGAQVKFIKAQAPAGRTVPSAQATPPTAPAAPAAKAPGPVRAAPPAKEKLVSIPINEADFKNDPLIQKALEIFKGQIVEVRA